MLLTNGKVSLVTPRDDKYKFISYHYDNQKGIAKDPVTKTEIWECAHCRGRISKDILDFYLNDFVMKNDDLF